MLNIKDPPSGAVPTPSIEFLSFDMVAFLTVFGHPPKLKLPVNVQVDADQRINLPFVNGTSVMDELDSTLQVVFAPVPLLATVNLHEAHSLD